jgi:hypothetical protein
MRRLIPCLTIVLVVSLAGFVSAATSTVVLAVEGMT